MELNENVIMLIDRLNKCGYRADVVGGSVRDHLLGRCASDYDLTTNAPPDEIKRVFSDLNTVDTGIKHGTVAVILDGEQYEITTYRKDGEYKDHRHPVGVAFTDELTEDLSRRDFTVNAMCYNPRDGITDVFSGREDLKKGLIRAVGDPWRRFDEDSLRILRAIRFAATLGFDIEENTAKAAKELSYLLSSVSGERIAVEWKKLIAGGGAYGIINEYSDILRTFLFLDEIKLPNEDLFYAAEPLVRHIALFALSGMDSAPKATERMRLDKKTGNIIASALANQGRSLKAVSDLQKLLRDVGSAAAHAVVKTQICLGRAEPSLLCLLDKTEAEGLPYRVSDLAVGGCDVMALGIKGTLVGTLLNDALDGVIDGKVANEKEALINYIKSYTDKT